MSKLEDYLVTQAGTSTAVGGSVLDSAIGNFPAIGDIMLSPNEKFGDTNGVSKFDLLLCDGSALDVTKYPLLAEKLGFEISGPLLGATADPDYSSTLLGGVVEFQNDILYCQAEFLRRYSDETVLGNIPALGGGSNAESDAATLGDYVYILPNLPWGNAGKILRYDGVELSTYLTYAAVMGEHWGIYATPVGLLVHCYSDADGYQVRVIDYDGAPIREFSVQNIGFSHQGVGFQSPDGMYCGCIGYQGWWYSNDGGVTINANYHGSLMNTAPDNGGYFYSMGAHYGWAAGYKSGGIGVLRVVNLDTSAAVTYEYAWAVAGVVTLSDGTPAYMKVENVSKYYDLQTSELLLDTGDVASVTRVSGGKTCKGRSDVFLSSASEVGQRLLATNYTLGHPAILPLMTSQDPSIPYKIIGDLT